MMTHDDLTDDAPDSVPWLLFGLVVLLAAIVAFTIGDPAYPDEPAPTVEEVSP